MRMANAIDSLPDAAPAMRDSHGRRIDYLRISVTDRCDLRCRYCMSETMQFLPRREILTLEEIAVIAERFRSAGVDQVLVVGSAAVALSTSVPASLLITATAWRSREEIRFLSGDQLSFAMETCSTLWVRWRGMAGRSPITRSALPTSVSSLWMSVCVRR